MSGSEIPDAAALLACPECGYPAGENPFCRYEEAHRRVAPLNQQAVSVAWESPFPCPDGEHIDADADGFCRGCGEQA